MSNLAKTYEYHADKVCQRVEATCPDIIAYPVIIIIVLSEYIMFVIDSLLSLFDIPGGKS